jgi:hypothetical protein
VSADWVTISSLATAAGTLVLAVATFASVRSANRAARAAERSLLAGLRPLLVPSQLTDEAQKVHFMDDKWVMVPGGGGVADVGKEAIYFALSLRNMGSGIAVLDGWWFEPDRITGNIEHSDPAKFHRLTRDLYIAPSSIGFWQGAFREPTWPIFGSAVEVIQARQHFTIELLYRDYEGGQRMISRFGFDARGDDAWIASASRHWNIDRPDPR